MTLSDVLDLAELGTYTCFPPKILNEYTMKYYQSAIIMGKAAFSTACLFTMCQTRATALSDMFLLIVRKWLKYI